MIRNKAPGWFWAVAAALLLWGLVGLVGFMFDPQVAGALPAGTDAYDRRMYMERPLWLTLVYGIATVSGLLGTVLLLMRRSAARTLYTVSLVAVVVMFGTILSTTDLIAHKGFVTAAGFPVVIALIAAFEVWLAVHARRRGWIG